MSPHTSPSAEQCCFCSRAMVTPGIQGGSRNAVPLVFGISDKPLGIRDTLALAKKKYRAEPEFFP